MNIGLLTQYYKPEMGAPQNRLYEMMRGLSDLGNDVSIVTAMPNYPTGRIFEGYKGKFSCTENIDGIEIKRYWLYASNVRKKLPRIWNMISFTLTSLCSLPYLRKKKLDYLIVESPPLTLALSGRWLAKLVGAKYVANISDLWPLSAKELGAVSEGRLYTALEKLENYIYRKSLFVMGQSEEIVSYTDKHGAKKTYLFRNGVDPTRFDISLKRKREQGESLRIIYAGLLGFAQGVCDICKSINFKELGAEFHIYGAGGEKDDLEKYLKENPDKGVFYHGVVSRDELPAVLLASDMTLIPLVKNIFGAVPSKIYESMAAGLPIMFMGEGEGAKIVRDNQIGLVANSLDYEKLKQNICYAVEHPEELVSMTRNCIDAAYNKFNRPKQIAALHQFLQDSNK